MGHAWIRDDSGAAAVEAAVMLPVLMLILVGLLYIQRIASSQQENLVKARRCGWHYAAHGCVDAAILPGCEPHVGATQRADDDLARAVVATGDQSALDTFLDIPLVGDALGLLFGTTARAGGHAAVTRPDLLGGGQARVDGALHLMCNTRGRRMQDVVEEAWASWW